MLSRFRSIARRTNPVPRSQRRCRRVLYRISAKSRSSCSFRRSSSPISIIAVRSCTRRSSRARAFRFVHPPVSVRMCVARASMSWDASIARFSGEPRARRRLRVWLCPPHGNECPMNRALKLLPARRQRSIATVPKLLGLLPPVNTCAHVYAERPRRDEVKTRAIYPCQAENVGEDLSRECDPSQINFVTATGKLA
jgi:hypothetical protein